MKVNVRLAGGFGNQLFQLAALERVLADQPNVELVNVDPTFLGNYSVSRVFSSLIFLDCFAKYYSINITQKRSIFSKLRIGKLPNISISNVAAVSKYSDIDKLKNQSLVAIDGYFQSPKNIFSNPFSAFLNREVIAPKTAQLSHIKDLGDYTALHVRRTDYMDKQNAALYHFLTERYYDSALELLNTSAKLLIFSDCVQTGLSFANRYQATFYSQNSSGVFEDFLMMANAKNFILANSTLSWFAALMAKENKKLFLPLHWHKKQMSDFHHGLGNNAKYLDNASS